MDIKQEYLKAAFPAAEKRSVSGNVKLAFANPLAQIALVGVVLVMVQMLAMSGMISSSFAYALGPYVMLGPITFALSFVLTFNEAFIITLMDVVTLGLCLMLVVMMVKSLQNYSFTETFAALLLTLFTMLMIVIALVIAAALVAQLWEFLTAVWKEARFYNEV